MSDSRCQVCGEGAPGRGDWVFVAALAKTRATGVGSSDLATCHLRFDGRMREKQQVDVVVGSRCRVRRDRTQGAPSLVLARVMEIVWVLACCCWRVRAPRLPFPTSLIFDFILFFILSPSLSPHSHLPPITTPPPPQHRQNGRQRRPGTSAPPESSAVLRECSDTTPRRDNKADSPNRGCRLLNMLTTPSYSTSSTPSSPPMPVPPPPTPCSVLP
jgi:hypothetical protein